MSKKYGLRTKYLFLFIAFSAAMTSLTLDFSDKAIYVIIRYGLLCISFSFLALSLLLKYEKKDERDHINFNKACWISLKVLIIFNLLMLFIVKYATINLLDITLNDIIIIMTIYLIIAYLVFTSLFFYLDKKT